MAATYHVPLSIQLALHFSTGCSQHDYHNDADSQELACSPATSTCQPSTATTTVHRHLHHHNYQHLDQSPSASARLSTIKQHQSSAEHDGVINTSVRRIHTSSAPQHAPADGTAVKSTTRRDLSCHSE